MNDYKTIKTAMDSVEIPIEMEQVFEENKMVGDEYAQTPYIDESVQMPGYPDTRKDFICEIVYNSEDAQIEVTVPDDLKGPLFMQFDEADIVSVPVTDSQAKYDVSGLESGDHTVAVIYKGDKNYKPGTETEQFTISE